MLFNHKLQLNMPKQKGYTNVVSQRSSHNFELIMSQVNI